MKKKILPMLCAGLIVFGTAACTTASETPSSSPMPTSTSAPAPTVSTIAPSPTPDVAMEHAMISDIMERELGETAPVAITAVGDLREIEDTDASWYSVDFTAGKRDLQAAFTVDGNGKKGLTAISKADDGLHYYYYKDADKVNALGVVMVHVYDYNTDEEIDVSSDASNHQETVEDVLAILSDMPNLEIDQDGTGDGALSLDVVLDSPYSDDPKTCAEYYYYFSAQFISEYLATGSLPYQVLGFNAIVDGENKGFMLMYTAPEAGLMGTIAPVITDQALRDVFAEAYDEYMMDIDTSAFS